MTNRNDVAGTSVAGMGMRFAEAVLPGHPDKLADQIADAIVDIALAHDDRAIVQVEVAVHNAICHVNGRVSTAGGALDPAYVEATVRAVYERAGFGVPFDGVGDGTDYAWPHPADVTVQLACTIDEADPDEHAMREYTDDQAFTSGMRSAHRRRDGCRWSSISRCCCATGYWLLRWKTARWAPVPTANC